ncbi:TIGR04255 family protein [Intrasporangium sp. DVR]|uniref:TIGR04255 family protein n=1 Tax=Intrasporangium sp. DVR TaxID=3127867 RepID=UPI00313A4E1F
MDATRRDYMAELGLTVPDPQHYSNAPIQEAILEIRVVGVDPALVDQLEKVVSCEGYSNVAKEYDVSGQIAFEGDQFVSSAEQRLVGYRALRHDGRRAVRARVDLLSFSWLRPYDRWESFIAEALQHLERYQKTVSAGAVSRVGVRMINRIDIEKQSVEIKDYVRTAVDISPYLPQMMTGYFFQVDVPLLGHDAQARIISTLVQPEKPATTSLVLDLDVWRDVDFGLTGGDSDSQLAPHLADLRTLKNYVFEACITDATRGLIR